uniref:Uncharacterized protein n=1 Tax=Oryza meridionalis TaxID=40149 RepID=A0A0E0D0J5_9ORYZ
MPRRRRPPLLWSDLGGREGRGKDRKCENGGDRVR